VLVPALVGRGRGGYRSLERQPLVGFDGSLVAEATITPPLLVHEIASRASQGLRSLPVRTVLELFARAADLFESGRPDGLEPEAYARSASLTSGLPLGIVRRQTLGAFPAALRHIGTFLEIQSPAGLDVFDSNVYEKGGIRVGLVPRGRNVGYVMPGNHPATHFTWLGALAMKVPVLVRPSSDDVFTPYRLASSLLAAGLPEDALAFVPGGHDLVDAIVQSCSLCVLFGMQPLADRHAANRSVKVHGPGRSKVVVPAGAELGPAVELITRMAMDDAGRGCINGSAVVVEGDPGPLAAAVAEALERVPLVSPLAEGAQLAAVRPGEAAAFDGLIDGLIGAAVEHTPGRGRRVVTADGATFLRPTVLEVGSFEHPLYGFELPFPFVVFAPARSREELIAGARNSLAVVVAGAHDESLARDLLLEPGIDKVFGGGSLGTEYDAREPHEGFLLDFLFQKKAVRSCASREGDQP
jgi:acyl-CoA reductase-like NAD-dependent aldehyde dehydrogenase